MLVRIGIYRVDWDQTNYMIMDDSASFKLMANHGFGNMKMLF